MAKKTTKPPLYDWGEGKGKVHTIPKATHAQNVEAKGYGINLNAPISQPLDQRAAYGIATQQADLAYGPGVQAAQQAQANVEPYFQNYLSRTLQQGKDLQAMSAPVLQQAQGYASQPATAAPGLDPNSAAGQQSAQAAQSGQGLAQLGYSTLAAIPAATQGYLTGAQNIAAGQLPLAQNYAAGQVTQAKQQRGQAVASNYATLRGNEQNAQIAYGTLGLNQANSAADVDIKRGVDPVTGQPLPQDAPTGYGAGAPGQNKYGYTYDEWTSLSPKEQAKERKGTDSAASKAQEKKQAAAEKKKQAIQQATGKIKNQVTDIIGQWSRGGTVEENVTTTDPLTGLTKTEKKTRKATPEEARSGLIDKYGYLARIAIAIKDGRKLDQRAVDYLHGLDPNFRVPREWLAKPSKTPSQAADPHGTGGPSETAPGAYGKI